MFKSLNLTAYDLSLANDGAELIYTFDTQAEHTGIAELLRELEQKYEGLASYAEGLSDAQFARTAHIPIFKDTPLTGHPTLGAFIGGLGQHHVQMHIDHLREILGQLAVA